MRSAVIMLAAALAALSAHAQERGAAPSPGCLDARRMQEIHQADARTFAVLDGDGGRFRLELGADCPLGGNAGAVLLAREGWVCGSGNEFVRTDATTCAVTALTRVDARTYAVLARAASRADDGVTTLETVSVHAPRRRGFAGSPSFCFNPRYLRAWAEDSQGMLVELSPRRSGGHRYYRVELAQNCPDLDSAPALVFRSGVGIGLICGNPGDRVIAQDSGGGSLFDAGDARPLLADDPRWPSRAGMRIQCTVSAVYPHAPEAGSTQAPR